jgi:uncharacterized protein (TIGR03083 family)
MTEPVVEQLETVWASIGSLCADFGEDEWRTPTALPGWTVQDCLSHIVGAERNLLGDPPSTADVSHLAHVTSPFAEMLEVEVEARRGRSGAEVLAEFTETVPRRLAQLRAMTDEEMSTPGWSPIGEVPYREFMAVRVFDCWMHEQDIRRAVGRPGHEAGPVVDTSMERFRAAMGFIVGKRAAAPEGSSVVLTVTGRPELVFPVVVEGRARLVGEVPAHPTVRIELPFPSFVALGGGRWDRHEAEAHGGLRLEGDEDLGRRVLDGMAFTP